MLGLGILGTVLWFILAHSIFSWKDRTLNMRAAHVEAVLAAPPQLDFPDSKYSRLEDLAGVLPEGELIQIVRSDGQRIFPVGRSLPEPKVFVSACSNPVIRDVVSGKEYFRVLCHPVTFANQPAYLLVPSPLAEDRLLLRNFTLGLYETVPLILLVSGIGGYMLSRRALQPVDVLIGEARTITARDLSRRLTVSSPDDQLRRLATEWNSLLARIESAMLRMTQFTADASHELRNPIAYIRTTAEYSLGNPDLDQEARDAFRAIVDETEITGELLENLLTLARLDSSVSPEDVEEIDVQSAVAVVATQLKSAAHKKHQRILVEWSEIPPPCLLMNKLHLKRVLIVVIDNAIKYTPEGGSILITSDFQDGFQLRVIDTGMGIDTGHIDRVFDRFYRVDQARSELCDGVGLGLSIAKWLMELYGANIRIESQIGEGTTIILSFPKSLLR